MGEKFKIMKTHYPDDERKDFLKKEEGRLENRKIIKILDNFKKKFNLDYFLANSHERNMIGGGDTSYYEDNPVYTYKQLNLESEGNIYDADGIEVAFHEYYHSLIEAISEKNPDLWRNLQKEADNDNLLQERMKENYKEDRNVDEAIVTKLGSLSREKLKNENDFSVVRKSYQNLQSFDKSILRDDISVKDIPSTLSMSQLVDLILISKGKLEL